MSTSSLSISLAGVALRNPVILAAGTAGYLDETADVLDLASVGAVVTKSITATPRDGNRTWRIIETHHGGMLNAIGLANLGVEAFERDIAPRAASLPCKVIGSISGFSVEEYVRVAAAMDEAAGVAAAELNVSCPNVHSGCEFGSDPALLAELVAAVRPVLSRKPLLVKLSPTVMGFREAGSGRSGIGPIARAAIDPGSVIHTPAQVAGPDNRPGADALCIANTVPAMAIDVRTRRPRLSRGSGGLSGPAVHPVAVKLVHDAYHEVCRGSGTPIVGVGGVLRWEDAAEFILAGASAVQMGTALFVDPRSPARVVRGLERWVRDQGCVSIAELVGAIAANE
jgi:dihydroorotate dehydrogenase (NAD+) catalytic subunit